MSVLQELFDSEINFELLARCGGGFEWRLGDDINGYVDSDVGETLDEALEQLTKAALNEYPESVFAKARL